MEQGNDIERLASSSSSPDDRLDRQSFRGPQQGSGAREKAWTAVVDLIRARKGRRPRKCLAGKLVDLIIARKCRRPRKCQASRHARRLGSRQAGQEAGQPLQAFHASRPGSGQARQQASPGQAG